MEVFSLLQREGVDDHKNDVEVKYFLSKVTSCDWINIVIIFPIMNFVAVHEALETLLNLFYNNIFYKTCQILSASKVTIQGGAIKPDTFQKISLRCKMQKWWWDKNNSKLYP